MPILGSTSVQFVTRSQIRPSPVSETMLRQNISTTFSLINAPSVKQLLGRKLLKIITWPDTTGKTNKYECYTLVFFFTYSSFKVMRRSTWRGLVQMFICVYFVRKKCQGRTMLRGMFSWYICQRLEVASLWNVEYAISCTRPILVLTPTRDLSMVSTSPVNILLLLLNPWFRRWRPGRGLFGEGWGKSLYVHSLWEASTEKGQCQKTCEAQASGRTWSKALDLWSLWKELQN